MPDTTTISVRLDCELKDRLEALARSTRRSKSYLAAEAIAEFVETNAWQIAEIEKAIKEADDGDFADAEEVERVRSKLTG